MKTLTETAPSIHAEAPAALDPAEVRRAAVTCIAVGTAPEELRGYARQWPGSRYAPWWPAVARDVEALTARGLTARHAERALRDGDPEVRTSWTASAPGARKAAKIFAAVVTSGDVRDMARGAPAPSKPMLRAIADAMDELTAAAEVLRPGDGRQ